MQTISFLLIILLPCAVSEFFHTRYDLKNLIFDLEPVRLFVGRWELTGMRGEQPKVVTPANTIDFTINTIPKFGSRTLNITEHWWQDGDRTRIYRTDYGFLPVKNATRFDPEVRTAILTTSSDGFSIMEQGTVETGPSIRTHLKQYMRRSFDMGGPFSGLDIKSLERLIQITGSKSMLMTVQSVTSHGNDDYTAEYTRVAP